MAYSPKVIREVVDFVTARCVDERKGTAYAEAAEKFGIRPKTISSWHVQARTKEPTVAISTGNAFPAEATIELTRETTTEVFLSDVHFHPEPRMGHDEAAWAVTEQALKILQPDILYFGGDICDMYAPSRYDKVPRLATPEAFDAEVEYSKTKLRELRELVPNSRFIWLTGNHETRLPRSVLSNAPWLANKLVNVESLLDLDRIECSFVDDGHSVGKLRHYHGHNNAGAGRVNTAKNKFERMLTSFIFGHHHKFSKWIQRDQDGSYFGAYGNGCMQYLETEYAKFPDWTQGFSVIQYSKSGKSHVDQILIHKPSVWSRHAELIYAGNHLRVDLG